MIMYILKIAEAVKKMSVNEIRDFTFKNYYKRIRFSKKKQLFFNETLGKKRFVVACKQINRKNKYTSSSSKWCILEVYLEYPKELRELHNDYPLSLVKIEIKREMLSNYQLKIADLYNIPISNVKKLVPNFFVKEKYVIHYENLPLYFRLGLKLKKYIAY